MGLTIKWFQLDQEFIKKERSVWDKENNVTQIIYESDNGPKKLVLSQFAGLYLLCFCGIFLSTAQFITEVLYQKRKLAKFHEFLGCELKN